MLILHGSFLDDRLLLWGETASPPPKRGRRKKEAAPASPYDPGGEELFGAIAEALPGNNWDWGDARPRAAWLPTAEDRPVASSRLVAEPAAAEAAVTLAPWMVTAIELPERVAVEMLCAAADRNTIVAGLVVGKALAFWATALRFAGALVARQQFLPGLRQAEEGYEARWQAVVTGPDAGRFGQLARTMPHACRALNNSTERPPDTPADGVLTAFLDTFVDHLVRSTTTVPAAKPQAARGRRKAASFDSVHDQWLHALRGDDPTLTGGAAELTDLTRQVREWRRPVAAASAAPFRLCFRLEEPDGNGATEKVSLPAGDWQLRYLLQANDDPSLLVPVEEVWKNKGKSAAVLRRGSFNPREFVLSALGQAAGIDPDIERSLKRANPSTLELDVNGAYRFLTEKGWLLEQAGFGVLLPAWWTRKGTKQRLGLRAHVKSPKMQGGSGLSLADLVEFDWKVAVGDHLLTFKELEELARMKAPLVRVRGEWVQLSADEIRAAIDFWKSKGNQRGTVRDALRMALGAADAPAKLPFAGLTAEGAIGELLDQFEGRADFAELSPPAGFHGTLRPYQVRGYSWLAFLRRWGLGACLADDMGLGKTIQTLALLEQNWHQDKRPSLLVCPVSVVGNWYKEAARFTPGLPVLVHHGLKRKKGASFAKEVGDCALVLSSYALLHRDAEQFKRVKWAAVILDEAQNVKNPETKQSKAARDLSADSRIALTGTPVENHVGDLWSISEFLNPGFLGTQSAFKRNFFVPIQAQRDPEATRRLKQITGPFILRRLKTDKNVIADLPEKLEMKVFCTLTKEQASLYAAVVEEATRAIDEAEGIDRRGRILGTLSKLKQVCNHPAHFLGDNSAIPDRSGKLQRLTEMLEELLDVGDRALIFTQFTEMGDILKKHLQETFGVEVLFLHGGVPKKKRDEMVERFQGVDGPPLFLLSLKAGGTGLNLTAANHVFHFDRWWNPAVENQATDRAFRIGQTRRVQVHKFLCLGTLEERIDEMIERKQEVAGLTVGTGEAWLTELSTAELKNVFALRETAIGE